MTRLQTVLMLYLDSESLNHGRGVWQQAVLQLSEAANQRMNQCVSADACGNLYKPALSFHICCVQEEALALATGVASAATHDDNEEDNDEESLDPAERRRQRMEAAASRPPIYNTEALHEKLEDISWPSEVLSPLSSLQIDAQVVVADPAIMGNVK